MSGNKFAVGAIGLFGIFMHELIKASEKNAKSESKLKALELRTDDQNAAVHEAEKRCDIYKELTNRESKEVSNKVKDWKAASGYNDKKSKIVANSYAELNDFKETIGYFDKVSEFSDDFDAGLEAFKKSINYDSEIEKLEDAIEKAESHYEKQKVAFELADDDISDTTMKLRHAAEEVMNTKVKEAKEKIEELKEQVKGETERLKKVKLEATKDLEEKVSKEKIRIDKKQDKALDKLNKELEDITNEIKNDIYKLRDHEQQLAVQNHENDIRLIREQKECDAEVASNILATTPREVKIGDYLKTKKIPKWAVCMVAAVPFIPLGYLVYQYMSFVGNVLDAM